MVPDLLLNRVSGLFKSLQSKLCCISMVMLWWAWLWVALLVDHVASEECRLKQLTPIPSVAYPILKVAGARPRDTVTLSCSCGKPQPACGRHEDQSMPQRCAIRTRRQMPDMPDSWAVLAGTWGCFSVFSSAGKIKKIATKSLQSTKTKPGSHTL